METETEKSLPTPTPTPRVRRRNIPSLDDAGYLLYSITTANNLTESTREVYNLFSKDLKRYYVKLALEIWREAEKCI
jgi:hypothetical protein